MSLSSFCAPLGSLCLFGFVGSIPGRSGGRRVYSGSSGSFSRYLGVVRFIMARPGGRRIHFGSLGSLGRALVVVGIIRTRRRGRLGHWGAPWVSSRSFGFPRGSSGSLGSFRRAKWVLGFVGFIRARSGFRWVHSHLAALWWSDSVGFVGFIRAHPVGRRVHSGSLGSFRRTVSLDGII